MEINFNVHGKKRKKLVMLIATYTKQQAEYQYTPTYAYQIGKYNVSRNGTLSSPDKIPPQLLEYLNKLGFNGTKVIQFNLSYPRENFTEQSLDNLRHLIWAKSQLIKDAFDIKSLHLIIDEQRVSFDWFDQISPEDTAAYQEFVDKLVQYAQSHQRIMSTPHEESNEKYAFRCFLLRLGFIGSKYKKQRKILLRNLTGSAAFKNTRRFSYEPN
ncbi:hypothetical protein A4V11_03940 [Pediococcus acidilactici]|uniref:hypothetical protein n=1 Tax=Pediococcus acidilactici TaxID=1254 RepID=UPI0008789357|nr:hypothetical protein [Pediococcus acidilactici]AOW74213.1 hypothetical protein A4V11_03940 [Pediococcus acidilactici]